MSDPDRLREHEGAGVVRLLPCPFCSGSPSFSDNEGEEWFADTWWIECDLCHARGPRQWNGADRLEWDNKSAITRTEADCRAAAAEAWNRRPA